MNTELIPVSEMARRLHVSKKTAYSYISPGGWLYHCRVPLHGRTVRVSREKFEETIARSVSKQETDA